MAEFARLVPPGIGVQSRGRILGGLGVLVLVALLLILQVPSAAGLVTFLLLTLWCHGPLSPFLPAAYEPVLLAYGQLFPPLLLAVVGGIASTAVELLNYYLYRRVLQYEPIGRTLQSTRTRWLTGGFRRWPFVTVWVCVLTPVPDWAARVLAAHSGYSVRRYLAAVLLARLPRFWFLAAVGLHLKLGTGAVLSIAGGSMAVTLAGLLRRQWRCLARRFHPTTSATSSAVMRATPLLLLGLIPALLPLGNLQAQASPSMLVGPAMGASMDRFIYEGIGTTAISFRFSDLRPGGVGTELGISLFPQALPGGVLLVAPDLGASYQLSVPGATLLVKAGGSAIANLGTAEVLFLPGLHLGAGLVIQTDKRSGLRIDLIEHFYRYSNEIERIWSIGLGFAVLSRGRT